jgi:transposase-like protein
VERLVTHIAIGSPAYIRGRVGVYRARCGCCKYFQSPIAGVPKGGKYSFEVRNKVANSLIRDRLPYRKVQERMLEDYCLRLSIGYIHECFMWAHEQINMSEHREWASKNFSGNLCIDEVHDSGRVLLYATDPTNDFTIHFAINTCNDQEHMNTFLMELKNMGIYPKVIITDGSHLYTGSLQEIWPEAEHQLCVFHVIKEVNKLLLGSLRAVKNVIKRQGNKGRKKKRGRKKAGPLSVKKGRTKKEESKFLWENQYLVVRKEETLSTDEKELLEQMIQIAPEIETIRGFNQEFYCLFERDITKEQARSRREHMLNKPEYQNDQLLARALCKLRDERFEKMIVFLDHGSEAQRTSNHVERNNRCFRMMQKTRYKRRTEHNIRMAIELDLYERMLRHPLKNQNILPSNPHHTCLEMAA